MKELEVSQEETPSNIRKRVFKQVLMVFSIGLGFTVMGMSAAYPNAAIVDIRENNSTLFGSSLILQPWQEDMMGSLVPGGGIIGTWIGGWSLKTIGRRKTMMVLMAPCIFSWCLVAFAASPAMILSGRFFNGLFSGMMSITGNVYAVELPDTNVRGSLSMISNVMVSIGFLVTAGLALVLRWYEIPLVAMGLFTACFISMFFIPESPTFLAVSGSETESRRVLRRLRGPSSNVEDELKLLRSLNEDKAHQPFFKLFRQREVLKGLLIMQGLFFIQTFCGFSVFMVNATRIFQDAGSSLDEEVSTILVFLVQMAGNVGSSLFLDRIGRRISLVVSLSVMSVALYAMGTYVYFADRDTLGGSIQEHWGWVPLLCLMVYMFSSSFGVGSVPFILNSEYFPTSIRAQASGIGFTGNAIYGMITLQLYTPMQTALGNHGLYWLYAAVSIVGVLFSLTCVKETMKIAVG